MLNICHWTEVYVDDDEQPTYRGTLLWRDEGIRLNQRTSVGLSRLPPIHFDAVSLVEDPRLAANGERVDHA